MVSNMDDFIRRQYTYRRISPNPMLRIERVWREHFPNEIDHVGSDSDDSDLGEIEEVEEQTLIQWLDLSIVKRLQVLHDLCEWQLHSEKFRERIGATTDLQMTRWRISPIGSDSFGRLYYLMTDGRLFRCQNPALGSAPIAKKKRKRDMDGNSAIHKKLKDDWTCIATKYEEWITLTESLDNRRNKDEQMLRDYISDTILPHLEEIEEEKRMRAAALKRKAEKIEAERVKEMLRQEMLATRKRSSRIAILDERRDAEQKRILEFQREQELQVRAYISAQKAAEEARQPSLPIRKTREARARDRELREFMDSRDGSTATTPNHVEPMNAAELPETIISQHASHEKLDGYTGINGSSTIPSESLIDESSAPLQNIERPQSESPTRHQATPDNTEVLQRPVEHINPPTAVHSSHEEHITMADKDYAWLARTVQDMTPGIPIARDSAFAGPPVSGKAQIEIAPEDYAWVAKTANDMTPGIAPAGNDSRQH